MNGVDYLLIYTIMLRRVWLFIITNIAIIAMISIVMFVVERVFGINLSWQWGWYISIFIYSAVIWFVGSFISLFLSKWSAKRAYWITPIIPEQVSDLSEKERVVWTVVEELAERNHIKMPEVGIYEDSEPNAFATWASKNSSLVAVSTGLLDTMDKDAIEWVVGHEMAHILNGDMVTMTLLQWVVNTFVIFAARIVANIFDNVTDGKFGSLWYFAVNIGLQILFGIFASLITMKFSRYREFRADAGSAQFVWKEKMIAGLRALQKMQDRMRKEDPKMAAMQISSRKSSWFKKFFSSHPDLEDRIQALEELRIM